MHALMLAVDYCSFSVTGNRVLHTVMCMPILATMSEMNVYSDSCRGQVNVPDLCG